MEYTRIAATAISIALTCTHAITKNPKSSGNLIKWNDVNSGLHRIPKDNTAVETVIFLIVKHSLVCYLVKHWNVNMRLQIPLLSVQISALFIISLDSARRDDSNATIRIAN